MHDWRDAVRRRMPGAEHDVVEELAQHLSDQHAELLGRGLSDQDARDQLLAELDDPDFGFSPELLAQRRARSAAGNPIGSRPTARGMLASVAHDLKYGWRGLSRTPGFTAVVVLSLAIVIGANTAIFGLMYSVLLRQLDVPRPEQLVSIRPQTGGQRITFRYADYKNLIKTPGLPPIEAYALQGATVTAQGNRTDLWVEMVTGGFFDLVGVRPLLGRALSRGDEQTSAPVALVSEDYWRQNLGADRNAVGKPLTINDVSYTIVGVMPHSYRGIFFAHPFTVAIPFSAAPDQSVLSRWGLSLIGRLPRGADDAAMGARLWGAYHNCCETPGAASDTYSRIAGKPSVMPPDAPFLASGGPVDTLDKSPHMRLVDASRGISWGVDFRAQYQRVLIALMAGVVLLLLIACANVGTMLLARATARQREFAVRLALGASRSRMTRQLLTESLELVALGSVLGLVFAWLATRLLLHNLPGNALQLGDVIAWRVSPAILGFTIAVTLGCTIAAGMWPARRASRTDILSPLSGAERVVSRSRWWSVDAGLAVAQMAFALVLVTAAALFVATLRNLETADGGYHTRNVLLARIDRDSIGLMGQTVVDEMRRLPGVEAAGVSYAAPVVNDFMMMIMTEIPGRTPVPGERPPEVNVVTPGFFASTGLGLRAGREFDAHDDASGEPVAIVSDAFARRYYPGRDPIGLSFIAQLRTRVSVRIVGIANDAKYMDLHGEPSAMWYRPLAQANATASPQRSIVVALRTGVDPVSLAPLVRRRIAELMPGATIRKISAVGQLLDDALAKERFAAALATAFGVVALCLAILGVYGVIAYNVTRRTTEIGVRMALGANSWDAVMLIMRQALVMAVCGVIIGAPLALLSGRAIASQLYGVTGTDWRVLAGTVVLLAAVGLAAGFIPSRRAAAVDPIRALRAD